jgi:predicted ATPase
MVTLALRMRTNDVVLVDELENGVHHSALERVWRGIERLAQAAGTQVFVTTHSYECIRAAAHGLCADAARLYRFERRDGATVVVAADGEALRAAVAEGLEVR